MYMSKGCKCKKSLEVKIFAVAAKVPYGYVVDLVYFECLKSDLNIIGLGYLDAFAREKDNKDNIKIYFLSGVSSGVCSSTEAATNKLIKTVSNIFITLFSIKLTVKSVTVL